MLSPVGHKVHAIVNYDNFSDLPDVVDEYSAMVGDLVRSVLSGATRYTTNGFLRTKLGDAFSRRAVAPHIYESADEARAHLRDAGRQGGKLNGMDSQMDRRARPVSPGEDPRSSERRCGWQRAWRSRRKIEAGRRRCSRTSPTAAMILAISTPNGSSPTTAIR